MVLLYSNKLIVLRLIQKATLAYPDWALGKKALQKSLYFFNLKWGLFSFRWADYGPLSGEIQQIARDLQATGRITVTDIETQKQDVFLKSMKYVQKPPAFTTPLKIEAALDETMEFVAGRTSRDLELLASVHFWAKKRQDGDIVDYVYFALEELKPDAGFTRENVASAIDELRKNSLLPQ